MTRTRTLERRNRARCKHEITLKSLTVLFSKWLHPELLLIAASKERYIEEII